MLCRGFTTGAHNGIILIFRVRQFTVPASVNGGDHRLHGRVRG